MQLSLPLRRDGGRLAAGAFACSLLLSPGSTAARADAPWRATGELAAVLVVRDCNETGGDVAVSRLEPPTIYVCPRVMALVRKSDPGAEQFYLVHEYGHVMQGTADEARADCWAAHELARTASGQRIVEAAIAHFRRRGIEPSPLYGTPAARAERIRECADEALER